MNEFNNYLATKKIDASTLQRNEPVLYGKFLHHFFQMHEKSFTARFLYKFNGLRRQYPLPDAEIREAVSKPKMKPKIIPQTKK
jgi:hypothetical protein